jgi:hypothetical protein
MYCTQRVKRSEVPALITPLVNKKKIDTGTVGFAGTSKRLPTTVRAFLNRSKLASLADHVQFVSPVGGTVTTASSFGDLPGFR